MNKRFVSMVVAVLSSVALFSVEAASTLDWQNSGTVYDVNGTTPMPLSSTYYVMLVEAANGTTIGFNPSTQTVGAGETLRWYSTWSPDLANTVGTFALTIQSGDTPPSGASGVGGVANGDYLYTVILNASAPGPSVTKYSILEGTTPTQVSVNPDTGYSLYTAPGNNTWQPVPEPSTVALMVAGLAVVAFGRRAFRK